MEKRRLKELEILRAFAFLFVIMQHALGSAPSDLSLNVGSLTLANVLMVIAEPGVAIFLFISGLTTTYSYKDNLDLKKYYKNRILYLIIPYFIFSYVNMLLYNPDRISNFLWETLAGNGTFHLWYMGMFIRLSLIYPLLIYIGRFIHRRNILIRIITFFALFKGYLFVASQESIIKSSVTNFLFGQGATDLQSRFVNISILFWSIYVIFGMYAAFNYNMFEYLIKKLRYIVYAIFMLSFFYKFSRQFDFVEFTRIYDIAYRFSNALMFYLIGCYIIKKEKLASVFCWISKYSYVGYMLHIYALYKFIFPLRSMGIVHPVLNAVISCSLALFYAPFLVYLISFIPYSKIITGVNDNSKHIKTIYTIIKPKLLSLYDSNIN